MGFPGIQQYNLPTLLVVLSGFEPERTISLIEEHEPYKVLLGIGDPPTKAEFLQRNENEQRIVKAKQLVEEFRFPANNAKECSKMLEGILKPYFGNFNIIIAPMSTKLSTVGVYLLAEKHPDVQVTYSLVEEYNIENYSDGIENFYLEVLPPPP